MSQRTMLDFLNSTLFKFFTDSEVKKYLYRAIGGFFISKSEKGAANGVATLDGNQKIPVNQLPNSIVEYLGLWYPSINDPSLADGDGNAGDTYRVADTKSGTISGLNDPSMVDFLPGQYILYSGTVWQKSVSTGIPLSYLDTDGTLSANSDTKVASQKATKTYIDTGLSNKQNSLGFTPENVANKATNLTTPDNTKYPTTQAVSTALNGKQDSLGFTPENVLNKSTIAGNTTSTTIYPHAKGVVDYITSLGYLTTSTAASTYVSLSGSYSNPTWITSLAWSKITGTPTTIAGYGITDPIVYTSGTYSNPTWITTLAWSKITGTPTTVSGYGITDGVVTGGSYSNPSWITSLAWSKISSTPTTLAGYGITDAITASTAASTYLPLTGGTLTGAVISSVNGGTGPTGVPALRFTGNLATAINDKPLFAIETNGSSGSWGADGTVIGVNIAGNIGANTTRLIDLQYNNSSQFYVQRNGNVVSSTSIQAGSISRLGWISNTALWSVSNGDLSITATNGTTSGSISLYSLGQNGTTISSDYERMRIFYLSGSGLTFSANVSLNIIATGNVVSITNSGSGYPPSITFITSVTGNNGTGATATITTNSSGAVTAVSIITGGTGYNNGTPTANFGISSGFYNFSSSAIGTGTTRNISVSVAGIQSCTFSNSGITVPQGTVSATSINFGTPGTGIYGNGSTEIRLSSNGTYTLLSNSSGIQTNNTFQINNGTLNFSATNSRIWGNENNGNIRLSNASGNDFNLLQFGGTTSLFPALKRSGSTIMVRTADDTLAANIDCNSVVSNSIYNRTNANNSLLTFSDNGLIASRNIADANPALIINQSNTSSTGNVQNWQYNSSNVATLERTGGINLGSSPTSSARITIGSALGSVSQIGILNTTHSTGQNFGVIGLGIAQTACTFTSTTSSGTIATTGVNTFAQPTLAASSATTLTNAATWYIANAPAAGSNVTITNPYALYTANGANYFGFTNTSLVFDQLNSTSAIIKENGNNNLCFQAYSLSFRTNGTTLKMYLDENGNFGLGSINPLTSMFSINNTTFSNSAAFSTSGFGIKQVACTYNSSATANTSGSHVAVNSFAVPTLTATNSQSTATAASTIYIAGAPVASTNMGTVTSLYALYIATGGSLFGGSVDINGLFSVGQNGTNSNAYIFSGNDIGSSSNNSLYFSTGTTVNYRALFNGNQVTTAMSTNANTVYSNVIVGSSPVKLGLNTTHPFLANMVVNAIGTVTTNGGTVATTASLYVNGVSTAGSNNYSLYVDNGNSIFKGSLFAAVHATYNLGSSSTRWANIYVNNTFTDYIRAATSGGINFQTSGGTTIAKTIDATGNIVIQNGGTFTDNTIDRLQVNGSAQMVGQVTKIQRLSANTNIDNTHSTVLGNAIGGIITLTLPSIGITDGRIFTFKKEDASANKVTLSFSGGIDGSSIYDLTIPNQAVTIQYFASAYYVISKYNL